MTRPYCATSLILALLLLGSGCANVVKRPITKRPPKPGTMVYIPRAKPVIATFWNDEGVSGTQRIIVNISRQRAYFYKGKKLVGESSVSTGRKGFDTPAGVYKIVQKDKDHRSNLYGQYVDGEGNVVRKDVDVTRDKQPAGSTFVGTKMPYFMRFTGGYGLHAGYIPGFRASHGCIRMPQAMAMRFFNAAQIGTTVVVED